MDGAAKRVAGALVLLALGTSWPAGAQTYDPAAERAKIDAV